MNSSKLNNEESIRDTNEIKLREEDSYENIFMKIKGLDKVDTDGFSNAMAFIQNQEKVKPLDLEKESYNESEKKQLYVDLAKMRNKTDKDYSPVKTIESNSDTEVNGLDDNRSKKNENFNDSLISKLKFNYEVGESTDYLEKISNVIFHAIAVIYIITGSQVYKLYRLTGTLDDGTELDTIDISAEEFQSQNWIHKKLGIQCRVGPHENAYKVISTIISEMFRYVETKYVYRQVGWYRRNNRMIYVQGKKQIGICDENIICECRNKLERSKKLSEKEAFNHVLKMLFIAPKQITQTLLSFTFVGILRQLFEDSGNVPRFILWLTAETGSYKTTLAKEFAIIFNRTKNEINASFRDTPASVEYKAAEYKDSILLLDDYYPSTSNYEKQKINAVADHIIRLYGDSIPKGRMTQHMEKQKDFKPSGMCVVTGEDTYQGGQSSRARCLHLSVDKNSVDLDILTECQEHPKYYSTFIYNFIRYISENYEVIVKDIEFKFKEFRKKHRNRFKHGRLLDSYVTLLLAYQLFLEYGEEIKAIDNDYAIQELEEAYENFGNLVENMNLDLYMEEPGIMYAKALDELISSNQVHLSYQDNQYEVSGGFMDNEYYYLFSEIMYQEIVQFYNKQGLKYSASKVKSHAALEALDLIVKDGQKRTVKKNFFNTGRKRYLMINREKLNKVVEEF